MKLTTTNIVLGVIVFLIAGFFISNILSKQNISSDTTVSQLTEDTQINDLSNITKADKIEIVNFHRTQRCISCSTLGKLSEKTVAEKFANEVKSGKVLFKSVDVELPKNKKIVKLYRASGSSLYINAIKNGENNIVQDMKVWEYLSDEPAFINYLESQIKKLL